MLQKLDKLIEIAIQKGTKKLAVAAAGDKAVLEAVKEAAEANIIMPVLVGNQENIENIAGDLGFDLTKFSIYNQPDPVEASRKAVSLIRKGEADILMKGLVSTAPLLKAVLNKEYGLRKGGTLSHFALIESPHYHKVFGVTDAAMNIAPEFQEKVDMVNNAVEIFHGLGNPEPKVAIIGPLEVVNPKIESTAHAAMLSKMNERGQIKTCVIDGPFAIDNAVSKRAAEQKGISGKVAGDADILMTPELNSGNVLYKTLTFLGGSTSAAIIMGAQAPIVLTSRADSEKSKMMSIALAAAM
ncbi:MAG: bifunctional enoyl-CoA hydratase/phosphate acetyltransferase [Bacteroidales bacterium]